MIFTNDIFNIERFVQERSNLWITILCKSLYVFLILKILLSWSVVQALIHYYPYQPHAWWVNIFYAPLVLAQFKTEIFLISFLSILLITLFIRINYISALLICWFSISFTRLTYPILNGSDLILNLFLATAVLMPVYPVSKHPEAKAFQKHISAIAVLFARIELALIYLISGYDKLISEAWHSGAAIYSIINLDLYFNPFFKINSNEFIYSILGWVVILFELGFAFLVWFKRFRSAFLIGGILFHLCIIVMLGLYDFGLLMIILYTVFFPFKRINESASYA